MKRPLDKLADLYRRHSPERDMFDDIETFLCNHYVLSTPESIILAKVVVKDAAEADIIEPTFVFNKPDCDCWFIYAYAGAKQDLLAYVPFDLTWVAWQRKGVAMRYKPLKTLQRHVPHRPLA